MKYLITLIILLGLIGCTTTTPPNQPEPTATPPQAEDVAIATFAGGCFWCTESDFEHLSGVVEAVSGFTGGDIEKPTYKQVSAGGTGHVEAVQVYYNPDIISYEQLLHAFWRMINPTDAGGQFVDRGYQYTSAIFYHTEEQKQLAEASKKALEESGKYDKPIVTRIEPFTVFYTAEDYHQDYYKKSPLKYKYYRSGSGRDQYLDEVWGEDRDA